MAMCAADAPMPYAIGARHQLADSDGRPDAGPLTKVGSAAMVRTGSGIRSVTSRLTQDPPAAGPGRLFLKASIWTFRT
jgi:hypothetical protein